VPDHATIARFLVIMGTRSNTFAGVLRLHAAAGPVSVGTVAIEPSPYPGSSIGERLYRVDPFAVDLERRAV
jgi:hypothetical protein